MGNSRAVLAAAAVILVLLEPGCASHFAERSSTVEEIPPSNEVMARMVVADALEQVPFGSLTDSLVSVRSIGDSVVAALVSDVTSMTLDHDGFGVTGEETRSAHIVVTVDSLVVMVREHRSLFGTRTTVRQAATSLTVEVISRPGISRSFRVTGTYRDQLDPVNANRLTIGAPAYVKVISSGNPLSMYGKPLTLAVFMTVLVWTLYSYRG